MIDRYDAPEGMVAVRCKDPPCEGCFFENKKEKCPYDNPEEMRCDWLMRHDNTDVIFVTRADFEAMLLQELEKFYNIKITKPIGKVYGLTFYSVENSSQRTET